MSFKTKLEASFIAHQFPEGILACSSLVKPVLVLLTAGIAVGLFLMYLTLENPEGVQ